MSTLHPLLLLLFLFFASSQTSFAQLQNQTSNFPWVASQNRTLKSNNSVFSAGFLPTNTTNQFIFSVYYTTITVDQTIWSVNADSPVNGSTSLNVTASGVLHLGETQIPGAPISSNNTTTNLLQLTTTNLLRFPPQPP